MNNLSIINFNGQFTIDSREVAEITEVRHSDLLEKISSYVQILENGKVRSLDFFIPSSYMVEGQQRNYPCYLLTRKGCDMVANKMTGEKGVLFTAAYVTKFEEMERQQKPLQINSKFLFQIAAQLEESEKQNLLLVTENAQQKQVISELKPKADYTDTILKNKGLVTITQIAKDYGMSGFEMNNILHEHGVQYKQSEQWLLYTKYQDKGYTHSETINIVRKDGRPDITMNTKWTQKGRLFIYALLKKSGILPVIEQALSA
jgi:Rha family phage regulatory protein